MKSDDQRYIERQSILLCPKCGEFLTEVILALTTRGYIRKNKKPTALFCKGCKHDLASIKEPEQPKNPITKF